MMAGSKPRSNHRPDTLLQDRLPPTRQRLLRRTAGPYIGSGAAMSATQGHVSSRLSSRPAVLRVRFDQVEVSAEPVPLQPADRGFELSKRHLPPALSKNTLQNG